MTIVEEITDGLDGLGLEAVTAKRKADALMLADALRNLAVKAERLAEELPE